MDLSRSYRLQRCNLLTQCFINRRQRRDISQCSVSLRADGLQLFSYLLDLRNRGVALLPNAAADLSADLFGDVGVRIVNEAGAYASLRRDGGDD